MRGIEAAALMLAGIAAWATAPAAGANTSALPQPRLAVDLDSDGKPDIVLLHQGPASVNVLIVFADPSHRPERFRFAVDPTREDAVCRVPVRLDVEPLDYDLTAAVGEAVPGFTRSKTAKGFRIVDGVCDAIHFFWNARTKRMQWWRL